MIKLGDIVKTILNEQLTGPLSNTAKQNIRYIILGINRMGRDNVDDQYIGAARELAKVKTYEDLEKVFQLPEVQFAVNTESYEDFLNSIEEDNNF